MVNSKLLGFVGMGITFQLNQPTLRKIAKRILDIDQEEGWRSISQKFIQTSRQYEDQSYTIDVWARKVRKDFEIPLTMHERITKDELLVCLYDVVSSHINQWKFQLLPYPNSLIAIFNFFEGHLDRRFWCMLPVNWPRRNFVKHF